MNNLFHYLNNILGQSSTKNQQMQDTQRYLNSILQKRLGSVPNHGYFSKNGNTVTRLPKRQQKLQSMPTVFRVKTQTIYKTTGVMPGMNTSKNPLLNSSQMNNDNLPLKKQQSGGSNHRIEYVAISKRLESKKQQFTAPTVDVSKYRKTTYIPPEQVPHSLHQPQQQITSMYKQNSRQQKYPSHLQHQIMQNDIKSEQMRSTFNSNSNTNSIKGGGQVQLTQNSKYINNNNVISNNLRNTQNHDINRMSQVSDLSQGASKRRKIFGGFSKEKDNINSSRQQ